MHTRVDSKLVQIFPSICFCDFIESLQMITFAKLFLILIRSAFSIYNTKSLYSTSYISVSEIYINPQGPGTALSVVWLMYKLDVF